MLTIIYYLFITIISIQLFYYGFLFRKLIHNNNKTSTENIPISVIVWIKNQANTIGNLIPLLTTQEYPDYEIILLNDASTDDTLEVLKTFEKQHHNIKIVDVKNNETFWANKKYSLTLGIKAAQKEYLLFIDGTCYPDSTLWIKQMSNQFTNNKSIVLGYSGYKKIPQSFLNLLIRFENSTNALQYLSWARIGSPYTGTGKNLAYSKELFFNTSGFINHMKSLHGEDELFINQVANRENTTLCMNPDSFTYSEPEKTVTTWLNQCKKSYAVAYDYAPIDKLKLSLFYVSQGLFLLLAIILFIFQFCWIIVLGLLLIRYTCATITWWHTSKKLKQKDTAYWYPVLEIILVFIKLYLFMTFSKPKSSSWK